MKIQFKTMNTLSNYEAWQQERYGDIIPENPAEDFEAHLEEEKRFNEWITVNAELNLIAEDHL
jgi:hypothetical protein